VWVRFYFGAIQVVGAFFTGVFFGAIFVAVVLIGALCLMVCCIYRLNGYKKTPIKAFLVMQ